jgi:TonB family protein
VNDAEPTIAGGTAAADDGLGRGTRNPLAQGDVALPTDPTVRLAPTARVGSGTSLDVDVTASRRAQTGVVLTEDNDIIEMVVAVVGVELPKLRWQCYETLLKRDESLAGVWMLDFTVTEAGRVNAVSVAPQARASAELESCVAERVTAWQFQPIKAPLPVRKTLRFKS